MVTAPLSFLNLEIHNCTFSYNNSTVALSLNGNKWTLATLTNSIFQSNIGVEVNELYLGSIYSLTMSDNQFKDLNPHTPSIATAIYKVGNATLSMT